MTDMVKVSLILPVYNVEGYLRECLDSCIKQTLDDIEIICVDDGSTDGSLKILEEYAERDKKIQIIKRENGGLSAARNTGLRAASGEWIMFLDTDDYLEPCACERVYSEAMEHSPDIIIFGTNIFPTDPEPTKWHRSVLHIKSRLYTKATPDLIFKEDGAKPFVWRQSFSRELLSTTGVMFDEDVRYGEDIVFQFRIFPRARSVSFISDRLYNYRWYREGSLMASFGTDPSLKLERHLALSDIILGAWREMGLGKKYALKLLKWFCQFVIYDLVHKDVGDKAEYARRAREIIKKYSLDKVSWRLMLRTALLYRRFMRI